MLGSLLKHTVSPKVHRREEEKQVPMSSTSGHDGIGGA